jgi:agmatinase
VSFLGARAPGTGLPPGALTLSGVPYDATASFRRGSRFAPEAIRWASDSIETYSPLLRRDLDTVPFVDAGDLPVEGLGAPKMVSVVRRHLGTGVPFLLGGEHTVTLAGVRALTPRYPDLVVIQWDAHTDLREEDRGSPLTHATVMRHLLNTGCPLVQLGVRAGTRAEFDVAHRRSLHISRGVALPPSLLETLKGRPLYLTVDVDVLDPAVAPGTGNPEPDGAAYPELLSALLSLAGHRIVGMDLVEVCPPCDPTGATAVMAATLVREMILLFAPGSAA